MSNARIYTLFQDIFPALRQQDIPTESPEHFGEFYDWLNLNDTYLQPLDLITYTEHGFENNVLLSKPHFTDQQIEKRIEKRVYAFLNSQQHYSESMIRQEILRLIICTLNDCLQEQGLDLLIISLQNQKYWLTYPQIAQQARCQLIELFKSEFNAELPIQVLDPQKMALFC